MNEKEYALWQQGLTQDDPTLVKQAAGSIFPGERIECLSSALATHPFPTRSLGVLDDLGWFKDNWMMEASRSNLPHDWPAIISWRYERIGKTRADEEVQMAVEAGLGQLVWQRSPNPSEPTNLDCMLLAALSRPGSTSLHDTILSRTHPCSLFDLSTKERGHAWLANSGLDVGGVIQAGIQGGHHVQKMNPGMDWTPGELPHTPLDRWLDLHPTYRQTWDRCVAQDLARAHQFEQWRRRWMPDSWHDSDLKQWCEQQIHGRPWDGDCPLEAPFLAKVASNMNVHDIASKLHYALSPITRYSADCSVLVDTIHSMRIQSEVAYGPGERILLLPPTVLCAGLAGAHPWIDDFIQSEAGALYAQDSMAKDARVTMALCSWTSRRITETILAQPAWQTWRDDRGRNLLHIHLDLGAHDDKRPTERMMLYLAKQAPGILCEPDCHGRSLLGAFPMLEGTRKKLERTILQKHIASVERRPARAKARM